MYKITLYDSNIPSGASGTISYYCENIDIFAEKWMQLETAEDRKERFLRSKNGEIVTDYYSDNPDLNIVQEDEDAEIYFEKVLVFKDKWLDLHNGFGWKKEFHFDELRVGLKYVRYDGNLLRLATYRAKGVCCRDFFSSDKSYCDVSCYGNPVLIESENQEPFRSDNTEDFKEKTIECIAYLPLGTFEDMKSMRKDFDNPDLSDEWLDRLLCDILGDAG